MLFARAVLSGVEPNSIRTLLRRSDLDLLQLEIPSVTGSNAIDDSLDGWSRLQAQFPGVHSAIYLRPELRVVIGIGCGSLHDQMTALAELMVTHGSADVPIAAIRGDNLQANLSEVVPELQLPKDRAVLNARVLMGAGPFATAFSEGARVVVAGVYDTSAPLIGVAVARGLCEWHEHECLAKLAATAQFKGVVVEMNEAGGITLEAAAREQVPRIRSLGKVRHADVSCDYSDLKLEPSTHGSLEPAGIISRASSGNWNVEVVIESGYQVSAFLTGITERTAELLGAVVASIDGGTMACQEYRATAPANVPSEPLLQIEFRHDASGKCREFLEWLQLSLHDTSEVGKLIGPQPCVERLTETLTFQISADRVVVSVDTRPAREWL